MMKHTIVSLAIVMAAGSAAEAKPLVQGTWQLVKMKDAGKKEVDAATALKVGTWSRITLDFDGNTATATAETLDTDEHGKFFGCSAGVSVDIQWSAKGFKVPANVKGSGMVRAFVKLTPDSDDSAEQHCSVGLSGGNYTVTPVGDGWKAVMADGTTLTFAKTADVDKTEWRTHLAP